MPKTGLEPITVSYKETVLPIKLFRPNIGLYLYHFTLSLFEVFFFTITYERDGASELKYT